MVSVSERLYRKGGIGSFVLGSTTTESDKSPNGTEFFLHQLYLDYQTQALEGYIGQTDTGTRLVDFPTLRGDNLNEFVNVLNPFSSGDNVQEHRYTNQATVVLNRNLRSFLKLHAQNLITSSQNNIGQGGINSYGINYQYQELPCLTIACNTEDVDLQVLFLIVPLAGNHLCDTLDLTFLKIIFFGFSHT